jgi:hypothetical protein
MTVWAAGNRHKKTLGLIFKYLN